MLLEAPQAVITAWYYTLLGTCIARDGPAVVEHLVAGFDQQEVPARRNGRNVQFFPIEEVRLGQHVGLAGMQVVLRSQERAQSDVRIDGRIEQRRPAIVLFG